MTTCSTCRYFLDGVQKCRRYPSDWPSVIPSDWCGEHKPNLTLARKWPLEPVSDLKSIGERSARLLRECGIVSVGDLLEADMAVCARIRAIPDLGVRILNARDREIRRREERRG